MFGQCVCMRICLWWVWLVICRFSFSRAPVLNTFFPLLSHALAQFTREPSLKMNEHIKTKEPRTGIFLLNSILCVCACLRLLFDSCLRCCCCCCFILGGDFKRKLKAVECLFFFLFSQMYIRFVSFRFIVVMDMQCNRMHNFGPLLTIVLGIVQCTIKCIPTVRMNLIPQSF